MEKILQEEIEDISSDAPEGKLTIVHLNALKEQAKTIEGSLRGVKPKIAKKIKEKGKQDDALSSVFLKEINVIVYLAKKYTEIADKILLAFKELAGKPYGDKGKHIVNAFHDIVGLAVPKDLANEKEKISFAKSYESLRAIYDAAFSDISIINKATTDIGDLKLKITDGKGTEIDNIYIKSLDELKQKIQLAARDIPEFQLQGANQQSFQTALDDAQPKRKALNMFKSVFQNLLKDIKDDYIKRIDVFLGLGATDKGSGGSGSDGQFAKAMSKIAEVSELITTDVDKNQIIFSSKTEINPETKEKIKKVFDEKQEFNEINLINTFVSEIDKPPIIENFWNKLNLFATKTDMERKEFLNTINVSPDIDTIQNYDNKQQDDDIKTFATFLAALKKIIEEGAAPKEKVLPNSDQIINFINKTKTFVAEINKGPSVFFSGTEGEGLDEINVIKVRDVYRIGNQFFEDLNEKLKDREYMNIMVGAIQTEPNPNAFKKFDLNKIREVYEVFPKIPEQKIEEIKADLKRLVENEQTIQQQLEIVDAPLDDYWDAIKSVVDSNDSDKLHEIYNFVYRWLTENKEELLKFLHGDTDTPEAPTSDPEEPEEEITKDNFVTSLNDKLDEDEKLTEADIAVINFLLGSDKITEAAYDVEIGADNEAKATERKEGEESSIQEFDTQILTIAKNKGMNEEQLRTLQLVISKLQKTKMIKAFYDLIPKEPSQPKDNKEEIRKTVEKLFDRIEEYNRTVDVIAAYSSFINDMNKLTGEKKSFNEENFNKDIKGKMDTWPHYNENEPSGAATEKYKNIEYAVGTISKYGEYIPQGKDNVRAAIFKKLLKIYKFPLDFKPTEEIKQEKLADELAKERELDDEKAKKAREYLALLNIVPEKEYDKVLSNIESKKEGSGTIFGKLWDVMFAGDIKRNQAANSAKTVLEIIKKTAGIKDLYKLYNQYKENEHWDIIKDYFRIKFYKTAMAFLSNAEANDKHKEILRFLTEVYPTMPDDIGSDEQKKTVKKKADDKFKDLFPDQEDSEMTEEEKAAFDALELKQFATDEAVLKESNEEREEKQYSDAELEVRGILDMLSQFTNFRELDEKKTTTITNFFLRLAKNKKGSAIKYFSEKTEKQLGITGETKTQIQNNKEYYHIAMKHIGRYFQKYRPIYDELQKEPPVFKEKNNEVDGLAGKFADQSRNMYVQLYKKGMGTNNKSRFNEILTAMINDEPKAAYEQVQSQKENPVLGFMAPFDALESYFEYLNVAKKAKELIFGTKDEPGWGEDAIDNRENELEEKLTKLIKPLIREKLKRKRNGKKNLRN